MKNTTPEQARALARVVLDEHSRDALRSLADQLEAAQDKHKTLVKWIDDKSLPERLYSAGVEQEKTIRELAAERDSYKKDAERYTKKYQHYHMGIKGRVCAVCEFDVTDPIHIREITKGAAHD
jgi:hypothetical protein